MRARNRVVHQLARDELAVVVVNGLFPQCLAEPLRHAAVHLAVHDERIQDVAAIVHRNVAPNFDLPRFAINVSDHDVRAKRECKVRRLPEARGHQPGLRIRRQFQCAIGSASDFLERFGLAAFIVDDLSADQGNVFGFEQHGAEFFDLGFQVLQRVVQRRAANGGSAAAERANAVLHHGGVAANYQNVVEANAEFVRGNLRERCLFALAVRASAGHDSHFAARLDFHRGALPAARGSRGRRADGANFAVRGNADADVFALFARVGLFLAKLHITDQVQRLL